MIFILFVVVLLAFLISVGQNKASVVLCTSFSCSFNIGGRCVRQKIVIYDNTIIGLCLYHSASMKKRVFDPLGKDTVIERDKPNSKMITKIMRADEDKTDSELIKDPKAFARWMRKKGIL